MASTMVAVGVAVATVGLAGRMIMRRAPNLATKLNEAVKTLPKLDESITATRYYKGGFEPKMSKREASLILGVSPSANIMRIKEAHRRIMIINHPDKGGSPYIASKINEAKDLLDASTKR